MILRLSVGRYQLATLVDIARFASSSVSWPKTLPEMITVDSKGHYVAATSAFRNRITKDGSSGFPAERDRYHLYVSYACPWACRTLVMRALKGLEDVISFDVVDWLLVRDGRGWKFSPEKVGCTADTVSGKAYLKDVYLSSDGEYTGRITVPVLFDKKQLVIVNNESSEIIRMLNSEFNEFCRTPAQAELDFYPEALRGKIDELNSWIYPGINNGVYRSGFAKSQQAYNEAVADLFHSLDRAEQILSTSRYLAGHVMTEADIRLFTTLVRFDQVYHGHFKCNKKTLREYPHLWAYTRDIYQMPGVASTVDMEQIKNHYMQSMPDLNPLGIVSAGPDLDFTAAHNREMVGEFPIGLPV